MDDLTQVVTEESEARMALESKLQALLDLLAQHDIVIEDA